ncbi:hypothetical protein BDZ89DRAFT_1028154 [Hymenopellis radicata]|nr:hypothetical protein BDZ89DRAFT_1028154 [Hymenopellis radicata]
MFSLDSAALRVFPALGRTLKILYLFTKSDIKTLLIPVSCFAVASAPLSDISRVPGVVFWTWMHLLQLDVSNQLVGIEEDRYNKPNRPLPAKLITQNNAILLRWLLVPACFALSYWYSAAVLGASAAIALLTVIYNEFGAHAHHWITRNLVNAAGIASYEWGATLVAGADCALLTDVGLCAIYVSCGVIATTIHTQDFKDVEGDKMNNRRTFPIHHPVASRCSVLVAVMGWAVLLIPMWCLGSWFGLPFAGLSLLVSLRFLVLRTRADDEVSYYYWYNLWLSSVHLLPAVWRFREGYVV